MNVTFAGAAPSEAVGDLAAALRARLDERGAVVDGDPKAARLVFNLSSAASPRAHWTRSHGGQYGVALLAVDEGAVPHRDGRLACSPSDVLALAYPALLKTLSNAVVTVDRAALTLVTPEMGVRPLVDPAGRADAVLGAVLPLALARLAIENTVQDDLPPLDAAQESRVASLRGGGRKLASLGLLPSVVRLDGFLTPEDQRLLEALFGLRQVSYGNLSVREPGGGFWMTGRGVDKGRLDVVGRDVLLVTSVDEAAGSVTIRTPPGMRSARVSVDAIEHALVYDAFPEVGAVVHVHAWMEGIDSTRQNYPCGTVELARDVRDLLARQPRPSSAIIGLRNHGVTVTGESLGDVFASVEGRLVREIPPT